MKLTLLDTYDFESLGIEGDVEAIIIVDNRNSKYKIKRNYKVLTRLHTIGGYVKDRDRLDRNGKFLGLANWSVKLFKGCFLGSRL